MVEFYIKGVIKRSKNEIFKNAEKVKFLQVLFLLANVHRYTFLPILFIFCWNSVFPPFMHYILLCPFFCFLKFVLGTTCRSFLIFLHKFNMSSNQQRENRGFWKKYFSGGFAPKRPKMGLKRDFWMVLWIMLRKLNYRFFYSKKILFLFFQPIRSQNWL